ncbi:DUF4432 family protein [Agrobacterium sp. T29]|uniref:DUF4432 family protein n=1 Tax=Agrobacterium sp. T29 TaxID=2580515 RepID=UPI00143D427E|nr:DUF4432 family protein [Agrobacterium sp. T29]
MTVEIELSKKSFSEQKRLIARQGVIEAFGFRYASGIEALEIHNGAGTAVLLPFRGQQIWDVVFNGRRLTMQTIFDEPVNASNFHRSYGAFFVHCGATATGYPGPEDDHELHGELPYISYERAAIVFGSDAKGEYVELTGLVRDRKFFGPSFAFRPALRLHANATAFDLTVEVENLGGGTMPLMYLAHANFRPVDGSRLVDTLMPDPDRRWQVPAYLAGADDTLVSWHREVEADFNRHRTIKAGDRIEKEFGFSDAYHADMDGWAHAMQILPNGSADFISFRPRELRRGSRWLSRAPDRQALGICLPSTARPLGRKRTEENGNLLFLASGQRFRASLSFGAVDAQGAADLQARIITATSA